MNNQPPKFVVKYQENLWIFQTNGTVEKFLAFHKLCKFLGNFSPFEQLFYRKKVAECPWTTEFALVKATKYHESQPGNYWGPPYLQSQGKAPWGRGWIFFYPSNSKIYGKEPRYNQTSFLWTNFAVPWPFVIARLHCNLKRVRQLNGWIYWFCFSLHVQLFTQNWDLLSLKKIDLHDTGWTHRQDKYKKIQ